MKNRVWQAIVVIVFLVVLSRTALQRDLQASAFEEKINQSLENGYLPVVVLSQESGEYRSLGKSALWAAEYAADKVNENGGVNGCKVQIISENTNSEKSKALSLFQVQAGLLFWFLDQWMRRRPRILQKMWSVIRLLILRHILLRNPEIPWHRMESLI